MTDGPQLLVSWEPRWQAFRTALGPALGRTPELSEFYFFEHEGDPRFLVPWPSRWEEFVEALGPALARSHTALESECDHAPLRARGVLASLLVHAVVLGTGAYWLPWFHFPSQHRVEPRFQYELTYYPPVPPAPPKLRRGQRAEAEARRMTPRERRAREQAQRKEPRESPRTPVRVVMQASPQLPQMEDAGGAEAGRSGRSGGREAFHPTQTIRIARGPRMVTRVVDAPKLDLPRNDRAVANLVAVAAAPPPPPVIAASSRFTLPKDLAPQVAPPRAANPRRGVASMKLPAIPASPEVAPPPAEVAPSMRAVLDPKLVVPEPVVVGPTAANIGRELRAAQLGRTGELAAQVGVAEGEGNESGVPVSSDATRQSNVFGTGTDPNGSADGTADASGLVISTQPGDEVGVPGGTGGGSLAMSPSGTGTTGLGGSGGGTGIGQGTGPGSGLSGDGPGGAASGSGYGSDPNARGGISPGPGPGGSGSGSSHTGLAGVTIRGGTVNLPSFATGSAPTPPGRMPQQGGRRAPAVTVIATPRSGGALNTYGMLRGPRVYTIYIETRVGTGVLQFSERPSDARGFQSDLTAPEPLRVELPNTPMPRLIVACQLDRTGLLKNFRIIETSATDVAARILAALGQWRFRPVMRGDEAIDVDAILGFAVGTE